mgnify:CR=1 FL=1
MEIRKATSNDLMTIHNMAQVVFRHTYRDILSQEQMEYMMDMMYSMPNLEKQLEEGHHYYIAYDRCADSRNHESKDQTVTVVQKAAPPCGYVSVQYEGPDSEGIEVFHLHKIYVMPDRQGLGIGLKLFQTVIAHVRDLSSNARIELNVNKFNSAVNFYKHLGMRILLEEDFPIGNGFYKTDYIMGLDL